MVVAIFVLGIMQFVALQVSDDPIVRALWLTLAATTVFAFIGAALYWKYLRPRTQS